MNCANLLENLGYACAPRDNGALRLWSPFTFDDGEHLGVFVEPSGQGLWLVTDHADALIHASALGANLSKSRLDRMRNRLGGVQLSEGGALSLVSHQEDLPNAVTAVLNAAIAISHAERGWLPKTQEERFNTLLGKELDSVAGSRLLKKVAVTGVSGHQIEFPFAVDDPETGRQYIQTVAHGDERLDWGDVYKAGGKMLDLKSAGAEDNQRIVVVEDLP
ncbi:MAG: DUF1828 domain-containing protein, partial [Opitutaceae bacterium]